MNTPKSQRSCPVCKKRAVPVYKKLAKKMRAYCGNPNCGAVYPTKLPDNKSNWERLKGIQPLNTSRDDEK